MAGTQARRTALVVHPDLGVLSAFQSAFSQAGVTTIIARDLPTALMAITQHVFDTAVISSRVSEEGDGYALGGVLRLVFQRAFVAVIAPKTDVLTLKAAINNGLNEVFESGSQPQEIASLILMELESQSTPQMVPKRRLQ